MFNAPKLTNAGKALYYDNMAGTQIVFTTIQLGSGNISGPIAPMTALVTPVVTINAEAKSVSGQYAEISGHFSNAQLTDGFYFREIGVFAANPDYPNDRGKDILYCYQNAYDTADFIPVASVETVEKNITIPVIIGDAAAVSCTLSRSLILASMEDLDNHNKNQNAHEDLRKALEKKQEKITVSGLLKGDGKGGISAQQFDTKPTKDSGNLLTSGAVAAAMDAAAALTSAAEYSAAMTYAQGAYCTKDGKLYRCTVAIPQAEAWNAAHWTATTMGAELVAIYTTLANKAPGGFGLGIPANLANGDVNERHGNGFYEWGSIKPKNAPTLLRGEGTYMYMFEFGDDAGFTQIMGCYIQTSPGLICRQAFAKSGSVQFAEWEWINPPMALNTEYRTTERYMGRSVYKKLVALGEAPSTKGTKEIFPFGEDYSVGTYNVFSVDAHLSNYANDGGWTITTPHFSINGELVTDIRFSGVRIDFYSSGMTGYYGFALLKYTKLNE
ncbi:hypothetical protein [Dysosmobacter sp.]|uniref:hypothetical protein n=1 Tax=Dysosmobacter sp. TaxID=2591382 RepID=UPI003AB30F9B